MKNMDRTLLHDVIDRRAPQLLHLLDRLPMRDLTDDEREALREAIADELVSAGLDADGEVTRHGRLLDDLIDGLAPF